MNSERVNRRMASGATWDEFCDALKRAGRVVRRDGSPVDPFDQAEGFSIQAVANGAWHLREAGCIRGRPVG